MFDHHDRLLTLEKEIVKLRQENRVLHAVLDAANRQDYPALAAAVTRALAFTDLQTAPKTPGAQGYSVHFKLELLRLVEHLEQPGKISATLRHHGVANKTYYEWLENWNREGIRGLLPNRLKKKAVGKSNKEIMALCELEDRPNYWKPAFRSPEWPEDAFSVDWTGEHSETIEEQAQRSGEHVEWPSPMTLRKL
jgi:transposase-like protein